MLDAHWQLWLWVNDEYQAVVRHKQRSGTCSSRKLLTVYSLEPQMGSASSPGYVRYKPIIATHCFLEQISFVTIDQGKLRLYTLDWQGA